METHNLDAARSLSVSDEALKGLLAAIVESSDDAIISETFDGIITSWNTGAEKIFGHSAAEAVGRNISLIVPPERLKEEVDMLAEVRKGNRIDHFETVRLRKDGRHLDINLTISPIRDSAQQIIGVSNIAQDITARKEMERYRGLLTAIVESSDNAIVGETFDGIITEWNKGAERIFGYSATEVIGQNISLIVPEKLLNEERDILAQVHAGKRVEHVETSRVRKDGEHVDIDLTVSPAYNSRQRIVGASSIVQDVTARKELEARLLFYINELEKSNQTLSEYTASLVHDLKAPLRHIMQYCEFLKEEAGGRLDGNGMGYVNRLIVSTKRLQQLVDDLLSFSRISRELEELQELDLNEAVSEAIAELDFMIRESGAVIHVGALPSLPVHLPYIKQLFRNLLTNAIKYRGDKDPVITIDCADKGAYYLFSVRDNGIGISKEFHETIFTPFKRLHAQEVIEGSGLGLSICKRIIELYKGRIWVESTPGEGAAFFFSIPK